MSDPTIPVTWGDPTSTFQLRTKDREVLERAGVVFRAWRKEGIGRVRSIEVRRRSGNRGPVWEVVPSGRAPRFVAGGADRVVRVVEYEAVRELMSDGFGGVVAHGALVARNDSGVLVVGPGEAGKSTFATALWRSGWRLLGDDVALIAPDGRAWSAPRRTSLRDGSRGLVGDRVWERLRSTPSCDRTREGLLFHPHEVDGRSGPGSTTLTMIVFLARRGVRLGPAELRPLAPHEALLALVPYTHVVRIAGTGEAIRRIRPLADTIPAYDLGRGPLEAMKAWIEESVGGGDVSRGALE